MLFCVNSPYWQPLLTYECSNVKWSTFYKQFVAHTQIYHRHAWRNFVSLFGAEPPTRGRKTVAGAESWASSYATGNAAAPSAQVRK